MTDNPFEASSFNIVRQRASPNEVTLTSGHTVEKMERVYFRPPNADASGPGEWQVVKCADYHGEHFVYLDPLYETPALLTNPDKKDTGRGHWFAMCTCGSPAVILGPEEAKFEESGIEEQLLVCYIYHATLKKDGWGKHADQHGRRRWT